ncbi:type 1 glutamine amidotransferase domain-containing protein [Salinivibrio sp. IB643]|uniref:type 1 glutamine amidotransferase domain-containing protein n=1 Tax=Salinivibrio sp. IB643 TaxID=1909445 RepID=UPI0009894AE7|nr:type 1 glutamine amidotransferase domain-containing protein [Salinivibrio sp. IB643]OOF00057.1 type 1 glutamine amidotransferase domain-containing protein [Salinivibrio sp. IB643]
MQQHKILMVLTSHDAMGNTGHQTGFWLEEFTTPYYAFKDAGASIVVASPKGGKAPIDPNSEAEDAQAESTRRFDGDAELQDMVNNTVKLSDINAYEYDAIFYPGGHGPLWDLAEDPISRQLIETFYYQGKPVGAVCHGPAVFRHTRSDRDEPLVKGKRVTGFTNGEEAAVGLTEVVPFLVEDMLKENGGLYEKADDFISYVVTDGNLVTGQNPVSSEACVNAVLALLK